jgi:hypothetical protein
VARGIAAKLVAQRLKGGSKNHPILGKVEEDTHTAAYVGAKTKKELEGRKK